MSERDYIAKTPKSKETYRRAKNVLPGGVVYPIRYFDPYPFFVNRAKGSHLHDIDGNSYIDFWCTHTAMILGHSYPSVVETVRSQLENGFHYGVTHEKSIELAEMVTKMVPSAQIVTFLNTGTEANMYATRLARIYTKRNKIAKFEGGWHGGYDALHISVKYPLDEPSTGGLTKGVLEDTIVLPHNDLDGVKKAIKGHELALIVVEPVLGAGGFIPADKDFLKGLREICDETGTLLIFDEVITGFRLAPGGAQEYYGVTPDLTVIGKILGGGLTIGAIAGRADIMEHMDHTRYSGTEYAYRGGTGSGNVLAMVSGLATLKVLEKGKVYPHIDGLGRMVRESLQNIFDQSDMGAYVTGLGSLFACHFTKGKPVKDFRAASLKDVEASKGFHLHLVVNGIYCYSPQMIHGCISYAHTEEDIDTFLGVTEDFAKSYSRSK